MKLTLFAVRTVRIVAAVRHGRRVSVGQGGAVGGGVILRSGRRTERRRRTGNAARAGRRQPVVVPA